MSDEKSQAIASDVTDVDGLVARYAPIGRQMRRRRKIALVAVALLVPISALVIWQSRDRIAENVSGNGDSHRMERALTEVRDLKMSLKAEKGAVAAQRAELDRQQQIFSRQNDELAAQLVAINAQRKALADQGRQFEGKKAALAKALESSDQQRRNLQTSNASQASIDRQLREIERQKRLLQAQQRKFLDQGQELARELGEINQQRTEIERQRHAIEEQQAEVRKLLEQINPVGANRQRQSEKTPPAFADEAMLVDDPSADEMVGGEIATMASVEPAVLGQMRGGVDVGQDFSFAIGISRTTSINGVEQFSSAMYVNDLGRVAGMGASAPMLQLAQPMVIQNGAGNFVDADTLSSMALNNGTIIQNTLDNQTITNHTVLDVSLQNVSSLIQGVDLSRIARDGLSLPK